MNQLDILANNRDEILLAEVIGWLHDYRKCSDEQLKVQAANLTGQQALNRNEITTRFSIIASINLNLLGEIYSLKDLLNRKKETSSNYLLRYLKRCHDTAHFDKQDPDEDENYGKQNYPGVKISSPFGFETNVPSGLTNQLWSNVPWTKLANYSVNDRTSVMQQISMLFMQVGADTRHPINEINLWNWGILVGSLYKAAIAGALLSGHNPSSNDLRWRLLSVRVNGLDFITKVARLPDLLSRQQLLTDSLNKVRHLLEEEYPLGNEIYRDENGSLFVVADLQNNLLNMLDATNNSGETLNNLILKAFKQGTLKNDRALEIGGDNTPIVELDSNAWWGQDPDWKAKRESRQPLNNQIPSVDKILSQPIISLPLPQEINKSWQGHVAEVCIVCRLRPKRLINSFISDNVCDICRKRRLNRCQLWATKQSEQTIWIDEVDDINAKIALITGQFYLDDWLNGRLIESLVLKPCGAVKSPSFSRIWRVWETTHQFWQELRTDFTNSLSDERQRLILYLDKVPNLSPFNVYELNLDLTTLSVAWYPLASDGSGGYLISTDNLSYVALQLGAESEIFINPATAAIFVEDYVRSQFIHNNQSLVLYDTDASASERNKNWLAGYHVIKTDHQDIAYSMAIPILAEPRTFMALVPAEKSLDVLKTIKTKYEKEMGKVRNRLPLHLGVVYFHRRTPLRAALDAGRQMLDYHSPNSQTLWQVKSVQKGVLPPEKKELADDNKQFDKTITLELVELEPNDHTIIWHVPIKMGDGITPDDWYPYTFLKTNGDDSKVNGRQRVIKSKRPNETTPCWLVHVADLEAGDQIYFTPSTFDFEFLDTTARRFEIYYDKNGRRARQTRPFYLEDLDRLDKLWELIQYLAISQRHQIISTIETTRDMWFGQDEESQSVKDKVFHQFVADTLAGAMWPKHKWQSISENEQRMLIEAGVRGELADLAKLHMEILKDRKKRTDGNL